jgi:hypothetical protein
MGRSVWQIGVCVLLVGAAAGCTHSAVQQKTPPDPLLVTKKPVEGKPTSGKPEMTARFDPLPPPYPGREYANGEPPALVRPAQLSGLEPLSRDASARPVVKTDMPDSRP